jgi:hypothetical protein
MSPSAPTVSCHPLRSAPALTASSAGAAAAGLPRGRGTFASGGGMAVARHHATVAGPFVLRPQLAVPVRVPLAGSAVRLVSPSAVAPCGTAGRVALPLPAASPVSLVLPAGLRRARWVGGPCGPPAAARPWVRFARWLAPLDCSAPAGVAAGFGVVRWACGWPWVAPVPAPAVAAFRRWTGAPSRWWERGLRLSAAMLRAGLPALPFSGFNSLQLSGIVSRSWL